MKTVLIILGFRRSGSTVLTKSLGCHSKCSAIGEINYFFKEIKNSESPCGCGEKYYSCKYWNKIINEINSEKSTNVLKDDNKFNVEIGNELTRLKNILLLLPTIFFNKEYNYNYLRKKIENTFYLYFKLFKYSKSDILIDSTKTVFRALILASFAKKYKVNFKFIFLVRDGRAVLNSTQKGFYYVKQEDGTSNLTNVNTRKSIVEVKSWVFANSLYFILLKLFRNKKHIMVKHEDFCNKPKETLQQICKFAKINYEDEMLNIGKHENHILGGNSSRINAKEIRKQDEAWRNNLNKEDLKMFLSKAGWLNSLFGYNKR